MDGYIKTSNYPLYSPIGLTVTWYNPTGYTPSSYVVTVTPAYTYDCITWQFGEPSVINATEAEVRKSGKSRYVQTGEFNVPETAAAARFFMTVKLSDGPLLSLDENGNVAYDQAYTRPTPSNVSLDIVSDGGEPYALTMTASLQCEMTYLIKSDAFKEPLTGTFTNGEKITIPVENLNAAILPGDDVEMRISLRTIFVEDDLYAYMRRTVNGPSLGSNQVTVSSIEGAALRFEKNSEYVVPTFVGVIGHDMSMTADSNSGNIPTPPLDEEIEIIFVWKLFMSSYFEVKTATVHSDGVAYVNYGENMGESISFMGEPAVSYSTALSQNVYSVAGQTLPKAFYGKSAKRSITFTAKGTNVETPAEIDREKLEALALAGDAVLRMPGGVTHKVAVQSVAYGYGYGNKVTGITIPMVEVQ